MKKNYIGMAAVAVVSLLVPYTLTSYTIHVANVALIFAILAIGLFLTMGLSGQVNLGQIAFFGTGAYITAILTTNHGWGFWPAALLAVVGSILTGLIIGIPALRVQSHYLGIVTLGLAVAFTNLATNSSFTGAAQGINNIPGPTLPGIDLTSEYNYYYLELAALAFGIMLAKFIVGTPLGRRLRAMRDDDLAASSMGAEVPVLRMTAFAFGGLYGGVAGVLYSGLIHFVAPESFSLANMFFLLAMVVIGGRHSLWGSIIGAIALVVMQRVAGRLLHLCPTGIRRPRGLHGRIRADRPGRHTCTPLARSQARLRRSILKDGTLCPGCCDGRTHPSAGP